MNVAILNYQEPWHVLASTSLIKRFSKNNISNAVFFIASESIPIIQYNSKVKLICGYTLNSDEHFDLAINFSPTTESCHFMSEIKANRKIGFIEKNGSVGFSNKDVETYFEIMHGDTKTSKNIFQVLYKFCGESWRGEGYDLAYFPKNKTNKRKTGIAISNDGLRMFIKNNLLLRMTEQYHIPMKKNLYKRMDEINRCMYVLTDDLFTLHASIALRKNVEFLDINGLNTKIEFFGKGNYYEISDDKWRIQFEKNKRKETACEAVKTN
jgi:hypothetical protein